MTTPHPIITLTTDFSLADGTVGAMIGVIKSICPGAEVVNVASEIPPHDIHRGAWALLQAAPFFPPDAIHVAVVDPGVGGPRRGILALSEQGAFIGPDNGVLSWALQRTRNVRLRMLKNPAYRIAPVGVTFDARDLFAPAAAHLATGADPTTFGPIVHDAMKLAWPDPRRRKGKVEGEILVVDHFGNLITNVPLATVGQMFADRSFHIVLPDGRRAEFSRSYGDIKGELGAVINGTGVLEIAGNQRSAAAITGCGRGDLIIVTSKGTGA